MLRSVSADMKMDNSCCAVICASQLEVRRRDAGVLVEKSRIRG